MTASNLFRVINRYGGNLPPMPGVFPDYPAPVVRNAGAERELTMMRWGMPPPPRAGGPPVTNIRNTSSPHWRAWLKPENRPGGRLLCCGEHSRFRIDADDAANIGGKAERQKPRPCSKVDECMLLS
jgi:hypothetical protein